MTTEERRSIAFIQRPGDWPMWPLLPLKRGKARADDELGVIRSDDLLTVYLTLIFAPITAETPRITYHNEDALLAAGWEVD